MLYTPMTKRAMKLCFEAHKGQRDKSGIPYVFHPIHLAEQFDGKEAETCVALLHDVMEDTDYTVDDIREAGMSEEVIEALLLMTHDSKVDYMDYVSALGKNEIAWNVKVADLRHNSDLTRLDVVSEEDRERVRKYEKALKLLYSMHEMKGDEL